MARSKKWLGGVIRAGVFIIRRDIAGKPYNRSTRCTTLEGALAELARFEKDPQAYVPGGDAPERPAEYIYCVPKYLRFSKYSQGNSDKHVREQAAYFSNWATFLASRSVTFLRDITPSLCDDYKAWRSEGWATAENGICGKPVGPHSVALDIVAIKTLTRWAATRDPKLIPSDPLSDYSSPKRPKGSGKPKVFDGLEWWAKVRSHLADTWQLVGDVLLGSSIRYSSLSRLNPEDVDVVNDTLTLAGNKIKGKEGVTVYVSHKVAVAAKAVSMTRNLPKTSTDLNHALERACQAAGVPYFSCHSFRHTAASMAIDDGMAGAELQKRLAHANFATTERYIHSLGKGKDIYRGRI